MRQSGAVVGVLFLIAHIAADNDVVQLNNLEPTLKARADNIDPKDKQEARFFFNNKNWNTGQHVDKYYPQKEYSTEEDHSTEVFIGGLSGGDHSFESSLHHHFSHGNQLSHESREGMKKTTKKRRRTTAKPKKRKTKKPSKHHKRTKKPKTTTSTTTKMTTKPTTRKRKTRKTTTKRTSTTSTTPTTTLSTTSTSTTGTTTGFTSTTTPPSTTTTSATPPTTTSTTTKSTTPPTTTSTTTGTTTSPSTTTTTSSTTSPTTVTTTTPPTTTVTTTTTPPPTTTSTTPPTTTSTTTSTTTPPLTTTTTLSTTSTTSPTTTTSQPPTTTSTTPPTTTSTTTSTTTPPLTTTTTLSTTSTTSPTTTTSQPPATTSTTPPTTTSTTTSTTTPPLTTTTTLSTTSTTSPTTTTSQPPTTTSTTPPTTTSTTTSTTTPPLTTTTTLSTTSTTSPTTTTSQPPATTSTTPPPTTSTTTSTTTAPPTTTTLSNSRTTTPVPALVVALLDVTGLPVEGTRDYKKMCRMSQDKCNCPSSSIQSYDGTCNNLKHWGNGVAGSTLKRVMLPRYSDGESTVRRSVMGNHELPSARAVSASVFGTKNHADSTRTLLNAVYMMFLSLDVQEITSSKQVGEDTKSCCDPNGRMPSDLPKFCLPIEVSETDKFFRTFYQTCLSYERRMTASNCRRNGEAIQHVNLRPSYLDLSVVYGSSEEENKNLRAFEKGHLKMRLVPSGGRRRLSFLPIIENPTEVCGTSSDNARCYLTANAKVNQMVGLAALQTLYLRLHNGIADKLSSLNHHWSDDELYHEARRITIALHQHITYNEVLPSLLGNPIVERFGLNFNNFSQSYDEDMSAEAMSDFAAAISPLTSSLLPKTIRFMDEKRDVTREVDLLSSENLNSVLEEQGNLDSALRGLTAQSSEAFDRHFVKELLEREFGFNEVVRTGMDQIAVDIQMGRDLGISTYNDAREYCGLDRAIYFQGFNDVMSEEALQLLEKVYSSPEDVDLSVGLLQESPFEDAMLGRTGSCLFGEQFARLRQADRFFANAAGFNHSFTEAQLQSILATSFSSMVCEVSDLVKSMQPDAFQLISLNNPLTNCKDLPELDLSPWLNSKLPDTTCNIKE